jgi:hypothetical protein
MTDLELLKGFRDELSAEPDEERVRAGWDALHAIIRTGNGRTRIQVRRRRRRLLTGLGVAATAAALALALPVVMPSGTPGGASRAAAAVTFTTSDRYIVAVIQDPQADGDALRAAFREHGLDITLQLLPVSPSLVGKFVFEDVSNVGGSEIETLFDDRAACTTPGSLSCPIGLRIPVDFRGRATLALGRAAEQGEQYASANDAFAAGEALHCSGLRGMTVGHALPVLEGLGVTAIWRSNDPAIDDANGIDPSTIEDQFVTDAVGAAGGQVYIWASPDRPEEPQPGTPVAQYFAKLNRGC